MTGYTHTNYNHTNYKMQPANSLQANTQFKNYTYTFKTQVLHTPEP